MNDLVLASHLIINIKSQPNVKQTDNGKQILLSELQQSGGAFSWTDTRKVNFLIKHKAVIQSKRLDKRWRSPSLLPSAWPVVNPWHTHENREAKTPGYCTESQPLRNEYPHCNLSLASRIKGEGWHGVGGGLPCEWGKRDFVWNWFSKAYKIFIVWLSQ